MKAYIIQPRYSFNPEDLDRHITEELSFLDMCDENADIIVLPEYSEVLTSFPTTKEFNEALLKYNPIIEKKVKETAIRCKATVFANYGYKTDKGYRNTTHVIDKNGNEVGDSIDLSPCDYLLSPVFSWDDLNHEYVEVPFYE